VTRWRRVELTVRELNSRPKASVNWGAGIRGLGVAWVLASMSVWYDSPLPLVIAGLITAFSLFVPLRIGYILLSRDFAAFVLRASILVLVATAIAYPAAMAANSAQPPLAAIGSLLFVGLLIGTGAILFLTVKTATLRSLPSLLAAFTNVRARAHGLVVQMTAAVRRY